VITDEQAADPGRDGAAQAQPDTAPETASAAPRPRPLLRLHWALAVALASGLLLAAAFPPVGVWPFAVLAPALFVLTLYRRSLRGSFAVGVVFGVAFFVPLLAWVINLAWYAWIALAIASALIFAVFTIAQRLLLNLRWWPLAVAGWWVAAEAFRDRWPWGGFPWGRLAMSQTGLPTQGWAAIGGAPVLSFVVALTGTTLAWVLLTVLANRADPARWRRTAVAGVAFAAVAGVSCLPAALPLDPVPASAKTAEIAAIQGNVPRQRSLVAQVDEVIVTANHAAATEKLAAKVAAGTMPQPDLVIWPENSTSIDPTQDPAIYNEISTAASTIGRPIVVGAVLQDPYRNASLLWLPNKGPTTMYVKRQLVPFGEFLPLRGLMTKISSLTALLPQDMVPGHQAVVFNVGQIKLGPIICYEVAFDDLVRSEVAAGANVLTVQSNDATFEREGPITEESGQQLEMARIDAVEFDRAVVYASTTGSSAIISPDGQMSQKTGLWTQAEIEADVPLLTHQTLAEQVGAWPEWAIVAATALALCLAIAQGLGVGTGRRGLLVHVGRGRRRGNRQDDAEGQS
jgi:apolipoprotein N-acyltransferase